MQQFVKVVYDSLAFSRFRKHGAE